MNFKQFLEGGFINDEKAEEGKSKIKKDPNFKGTAVNNPPAASGGPAASTGSLGGATGGAMQNAPQPTK